MPDAFFINQYRKKAAQADAFVQSGRSAAFDAVGFLHAVREMLCLLDLRPEHDLLDVGCANGLVDILLSAASRSVLALEPVEELARLARRNLAECPNVSVEAGNGAAVPASAASFDRVLMLEVLQLVGPDEARTVFRELHRVSRNDARIVIGSIPHAGHRDRILGPYLDGVRKATHLSEEQKDEIVSRNQKANWYEPVELAAWWRELGCGAVAHTPSASHPHADHRFHLSVHVTK